MIAQNHRLFMPWPLAAGAALLLALCACERVEKQRNIPDAPAAASALNAPRVVVSGGVITEILAAIGGSGMIAGADTSSVYPEDLVSGLAKIGYRRQLAAEGVLALRPTLLLAQEDSGPPTALDNIRAAGIQVVMIPNVFDAAGAANRIEQVGSAAGLEEPAKKLAASVREEFDRVLGAVNPSKRPRAAFIYARGVNVLNGAGTGTEGHAMLSLAGAQNVFADVEGYKPIAADALVRTAPAFFVLPARGLESLGGVDGFLKIPGVADTPAGKNRAVIALDDLMLMGFGPRAPAALRELAGKLGTLQSR
ncbi:MAG: Hemin-binding periplasmic protein HmuT [Myxococcota bacterium]|nr:Hemin-binding periplasmic protein HmuT [Myxococcota bacterium]